MIKEEYVSWESAQLLKEAGFPQTADYINVPAKYLANPIRPTQAQAMRWLREKHHISVEPMVNIDEQWCVNVWEFKIVDVIANDEVDRFPTYEDAAEAAIQAACKYIINNKLKKSIDYVKRRRSICLRRT